MPPEPTNPGAEMAGPPTSFGGFTYYTFNNPDGTQELVTVNAEGEETRSTIEAQTDEKEANKLFRQGWAEWRQDMELRAAAEPNAEKRYRLGLAVDYIGNFEGRYMAAFKDAANRLNVPTEELGDFLSTYLQTAEMFVREDVPAEAWPGAGDSLLNVVQGVERRSARRAAFNDYIDFYSQKVGDIVTDTSIPEEVRNSVEHRWARFSEPRQQGVLREEFVGSDLATPAELVDPRLQQVFAMSVAGTEFAPAVGATPLDTVSGILSMPKQLAAEQETQAQQERQQGALQAAGALPFGQTAAGEQATGPDGQPLPQETPEQLAARREQMAQTAALPGALSSEQTRGLAALGLDPNQPPVIPGATAGGGLQEFFEGSPFFQGLDFDEQAFARERFEEMRAGLGDAETAERVDLALPSLGGIVEQTRELRERERRQDERARMAARGLTLPDVLKTGDPEADRRKARAFANTAQEFGVDVAIRAAGGEEVLGGSGVESMRRNLEERFQRADEALSPPPERPEPEPSESQERRRGPPRVIRP